MRQDRRLNGWVLISSIIQIILSVILLSAGIALAVVGFLYQDKLATIADLQVFITHLNIASLDMFGKVLKLEYLYLFVGIAIGVIGLIVLILSIVSLTYAQKRKVVRHRMALLVFSIIPLAIAGCAATYLWLEFKLLTDNIKYVAYGVSGAFGSMALFTILGVIFSRSEKFMSNDNNKYAFDNSSLRNARADVNNTVKTAQMQQKAPNQNAVYNMQPAPTQGVIPQRPAQNGPGASSMPRPMGQATARPVQQRPYTPNAQQPRPAQPQMARPMPPRPANQPARPMPSRPMSNPNQPRPVQAGHPRPNASSTKYCPKCGKQLNSNEKFCSLCGYKIAE